MLSVIINASNGTHQLHLDEVTVSRMAIELSFVVVGLVLNILFEKPTISLWEILALVRAQHGPVD